MTLCTKTLGTFLFSFLSLFVNMRERTCTLVVMTQGKRQLYLRYTPKGLVNVIIEASEITTSSSKYPMWDLTLMQHFHNLHTQCGTSLWVVTSITLSS